MNMEQQLLPLAQLDRRCPDQMQFRHVPLVYGLAMIYHIAYQTVVQQIQYSPMVIQYLWKVQYKLLPEHGMWAALQRSIAVMAITSLKIVNLVVFIAKVVPGSLLVEYGQLVSLFHVRSRGYFLMPV
jgi:hypothetical protein